MLVLAVVGWDVPPSVELTAVDGPVLVAVDVVVLDPLALELPEAELFDVVEGTDGALVVAATSETVTVCVATVVVQKNIRRRSLTVKVPAFV